MKIFFFSTGDFLEGNGSNSRIKAYAKGLKNAEVNISIFLFRSTDFNSTGINTLSEGKWEDIPFRYFSKTTKRPKFLLSRLWQLITASIKSAQTVHKNRASLDAIYIYSPSALFLPTYLAAKWNKIPIVVEKTELESTRKADGLKEIIGKLLFQMDEWYINLFADHLIVISERLKEHYAPKFKKPITLIPAVVDLERFPKPSVNGLKHRIGYLGSFGEKDGVEGILKAFKNFVNDTPDTKLRLMGYNNAPQKLDQQMKELKLNGEVENLGQLKYNDIPEKLRECDMLVVNRTNSPYSHYGFPTKLTEYLASGATCVVTRVGDVEKYLTDGEDVVFVSPENVQELSEAFTDFYNSPDSYRNLGIEGRKTCEKCFDYKIYIPTLINIFSGFKSTS